ncbi:MAG: hypothetical protein ABT11_19860 [Novosphingobium sp. SCN 66-18]|nr:MAG: hypothetical protein ABT11_19860 [Novosphingobium sp. SCN 66-18]
MAAPADGFDRLVEAGGLKNARGLVRSIGRPAHWSQRESKLVIAASVTAFVAQNDRREFLRRIFAHPFIRGGYADTRPTGRGKYGLGYGVMVDSHDVYWNI